MALLTADFSPGSLVLLLNCSLKHPKEAASDIGEIKKLTLKAETLAQTVKLSIDFSRICVMERTTGLMVVPSVRKVSKSMPFTSHGQTGNREFINKLKSANISVIPHFCNKWLCSLPKLYMIYTCVKF